MSLFYGELLFLYIAIEASLFVRRHSFYIILGLYMIFSVVSLFYHNSLTIGSGFAVAFMSAILYLLWRKIEERAELLFLHNEVVLEYRQLKRKAHENESMARLEERTRISREIHDSVGHKLTAVLMQLEMMSMEAHDPRLETVKKEVRDSLEEIRLAVRTLKHDEAAGLTSVLQLIRKLETESHISIHFTTKHGILSIKLSNDQSIVLYRVIQEALTNAMRYAASREIIVTLGRTAVGHFHINIKNRIKNAQSFQPGFGLQNMQERLEGIGGIMQAYQTEGYFIVDASFPLNGDGL